MASLGPNSVESRYVVDANHVQTFSHLSSTTGSTDVSWSMHEANNQPIENVNLSNRSYHHEQQRDDGMLNYQDGPSSAAVASSSTFPTIHVSQGYSSYASYPSSTEPYKYGSTGYSGYYSGYEQQPNHSYSVPVGTHQNTGAPNNQPLSSFQNTGSYAGTASYSGTYYNRTDYQNTEGHANGVYSNQATSWNEGNYAHYTSNPYPNYATNAASTYSSGTATETSLHYQPEYKQLEDYYCQTEVTCAPGTENLSTSESSNQVSSAPGLNAGISVSFSQPAPSFVQPLRPDSNPSQPTLVQPGTAFSGHHDIFWKYGSSSYQIQNSSHILQNYQNPLDQKPSHDHFQDQQKHSAPSYQIHNSSNIPQTYQNSLDPKPSYDIFQDQQFHGAPSYQIHNSSHIPQNYQNPLDPKVSHDNFRDQQIHGTPSFQVHNSGHRPQNYQNPLDPKLSYNNFQDRQKSAVQQGSNSQYSTAGQVLPTYQPPATLQGSRTLSKMQIPTNPRIASNLPLGLPKSEKDNSTANTSANPAYISSVSLPTRNIPADSVLKPGMFPKSLRTYVERALARCKDEEQKASCQAALKEMITKATADGTLYTRDWDTEPLFPLLDTNLVNKDLQGSAPSLLLSKRSPSTRPKSRWEPIPDEKKFCVWFPNVKEKKPLANFEGKVNGFSNDLRSPSSEQRSSSKNFLKRHKKQRFAKSFSAFANGDISSNSDVEEKLGASSSGTMAHANSLDEKKRRQDRSKRFQISQGRGRDNSISRPKNTNAGNLYARRTSALVLSRNFEQGGSERVEDIDWDALTIKGTCQDIEKRYLRLTSAPDHSTVRPEEVLEKALVMVQNSPKNYLFKCDQLKSIRQDLTVQRIQNQLTVKVYETHARLALEAGDLPEYNQCQSQLKVLYAEGIEGCKMEFFAYNLLHVILHSSNNRELLSSMSRLSAEAKKDKAIKHALAVRAAVTSGNYVMFFKLYKTAPNLNTCLIDLYVEKMRYKALNCLSRSYRPTVPVSHIAQVLGFIDEDTNGLEECLEWLKTHGACLVVDDNGEMQLDAKVSSSSLHMPEPDDAVSHGDPNIAVNDFFTRTSSCQD